MRCVVNGIVRCRRNRSGRVVRRGKGAGPLAETMPAVGCIVCNLRNGDVVHDAQRDSHFAFERWTRSARRQREHLPGPEWRQAPLDDITGGMTVTDDLAFL